MSYGSWGVELWDQGENLLKYCNDQVVSTDTYFRLFSEIQKIQHEFGKRLRKTVTNFQRKTPPAAEDFTYTSSFYQLIQSLSTIGSLFEENSKELCDDVAAMFKQLYDQERKQIDNQRIAYTRLTQNLDQLRRQLELTWQKYVTAFKDKQKAYDNWMRAEKELPAARIDQLKDLYNQKIHAFDQLKAQYASDLNKYNSGLIQHYNKSLMEYLEDMSLKNRDRLDKTKNLLEKMANIYEKTFNNLSDCARSMKDSVNALDSAKDDEFAIKLYKSGEFTPVDLPFLDLEHCPPSVLEGTNHALGSFMLGIDPAQLCTQLPGTTTGSSSGRSGLTRGSKTSRDESVTLRSPFICDISSRSVKDSDFTIIQLTDRLRDLADQIKRTESETDGTERLLTAYRENPSLGSASVVEPKVCLLKRRLLSLKEQAKQLENRYQQLGGEQGLREAQIQMLRIHSATESRSNATPRRTRTDSENSFDSGEWDTATAHRPSVSKTEDYVGQAVVKYEYEGNGAMCLAAKPGDFFLVVEFDTKNTGWTSVVSKDGSRRGLVPTEYIEITKY